jgi:hypothetical protein
MIWMEGFDGPGTVAALATKIGFSNTAPFSIVSALSGTGSALKQTATSTTAVNATVTLPSAVSPVYCAFKFQYETGASVPAAFTVVSFLSGAAIQCNLNFSTGSTFIIQNGAAATIGSFTVTKDAVHSLVIYLLPDDAGHVTVWLDGTVVVDADADFKTGVAAASVSSLSFRFSQYTNSTSYLNGTVDHLVISDSEIPDCNIVTLRPTADGNYAQFTPSTGSDHFALVDEATLSTADFNASSTAGHRDSFKFTEPLISGDIVGVAMEAFVDKSDAGARAVRHFVRQGGTDYDGAADLALTEAGNIASQYYEVNPATSAAFTVAELTGASRTEFGVKVQS